MSESKKFYSSHRNPSLIHQATLKLLEDNIQTLLEDIYDEKNQNSIYGHPEVRIGISLKLLHNIRIDLDESILKPIIKDIEMLMESDDYLKSTGDPERRKKCLQEELHFINRYIDLEDTITLNTIEPRQHTTPNNNKNTSTNNQNNANKNSTTISIMEQDLNASKHDLGKIGLTNTNTNTNYGSKHGRDKGDKMDETACIIQ